MMTLNYYFLCAALFLCGSWGWVLSFLFFCVQTHRDLGGNATVNPLLKRPRSDVLCTKMIRWCWQQFIYDILYSGEK